MLSSEFRASLRVTLEAKRLCEVTAIAQLPRNRAREAALWFIKWCEDRGGSVTLDADDQIRAVVNWRDYPVGNMTLETFGLIVDRLGDELRAVLTALRMVH